MSSFPFSSINLTRVPVQITDTTPTAIGRPIDMARLTKISVQAGSEDPTVSGFAGEIKLQASDFIETQGKLGDWPTDDTKWIDVAGASAALSGEDCVMFSSSNISSRWIRVVFTGSAGVGELQVFATCKHG